MRDGGCGGGGGGGGGGNGWTGREEVSFIRILCKRRRILLIILCKFQEKDGWVGEVGVYRGFYDDDRYRFE